ncbi:hypothetical protein QF034_008031 [Streptomyces africanus]|uniref:Secreted protein n=1 Tax=Streptomyces africanus TaxID=231024 RepID=A0ABU0R2B2_9ACTN|nr:hypothetical protein [Streptomyces africanus]MDQ0753800.1 hypothetical protein [Streptomyces africanus]
MNKLPYALLTALAGMVLAAPAHAAARPVDVTASQCIAGGGSIVISAVGDGWQSYTKRCMGRRPRRRDRPAGRRLRPDGALGRTRQALAPAKAEYGAESWETG